jgi:hypothetical protein
MELGPAELFAWFVNGVFRQSWNAPQAEACASKNWVRLEKTLFSKFRSGGGKGGPAPAYVGVYGTLPGIPTTIVRKWLGLKENIFRN